MEPTGSRIAEYYPKTVFSKRYPGLTEAVSGLTSASERLCGLLADLTPEDLQRPVAPGKWSPAEVADHLVLVNELFVRVIDSAQVPGSSPYLMPKGRLGEDGKAISAPEGEPRSGRAGEELSADIRRSTAALLESARHAREVGKLDEVCLVHAFFGDMSAAECVQMAAWHMGRHLRKLG